MSFPIFNKTYYSIMESLDSDIKKLPSEEILKKYLPVLRELGQMDESEVLHKTKNLPIEIKTDLANCCGLSVKSFTQFRKNHATEEDENVFYRACRRFYQNLMESVSEKAPEYKVIFPNGEAIFVKDWDELDKIFEKIPMGSKVFKQVNWSFDPTKDTKTWTFKFAKKPH